MGEVRVKSLDLTPFFLFSTTNVFIIDVSKKELISTVKGTGTLNRSDYGIATQDRTLGFHPNRVKVYNQIHKDIFPTLESVLK